MYENDGSGAFALLLLAIAGIISVVKLIQWAGSLLNILVMVGSFVIPLAIFFSILHYKEHHQ